MRPWSGESVFHGFTSSQPHSAGAGLLPARISALGTRIGAHWRGRARGETLTDECRLATQLRDYERLDARQISPRLRTAVLVRSYWRPRVR